MRLTLFLLCGALGATALGAEVAARAVADYRPLLLEQAKRYPAMTAQDCYKLLYQACHGAEHAVTDEAMAATWLDAEWAKLGPTATGEALLEPVTPDGTLVRVNLRPYRDQGGSAAALGRAFFLTGSHRAGTGDAMAAVWSQVEELAAQGRLPFSAEVAQRFGAQMARAGYPAVHHSEEYARAYRPAYRVVLKSLLPELVRK